MKKIYTILFCLLILSHLKGQSSAIDYTELKMNGQSILTIEKASLIGTIGQPISTQNINFEYLDLRYAEVLYYTLNSEFVFSSKPNEDGTQIKGFSVYSSSYLFSYSGQNFKVGDSITSLQTVFENSYLKRDTERKILTIRIGSNEGGSFELMDGDVTITFDDNNIITSITYAYAS